MKGREYYSREREKMCVTAHSFKSREMVKIHYYLTQIF